jgi:hypothetical protein
MPVRCNGRQKMNLYFIKLKYPCLYGHIKALWRQLCKVNLTTNFNFSRLPDTKGSASGIVAV